MGSLTKIDELAGVKIWSTSGDPKAFIFKAGMMIDADGAPNAYGPNNSGIDWTANGGNPTSGKPAAWWGGPVDLHNKAIIQQVYDPFPGYYVSGTALANPQFPEESPYRYMDSGCIPFIVLPGDHANGAKVGDVCFCYNEETKDNCYGVFADVGPSSKIGEASMRMAQALGVHDDPKKGGSDVKIITYLVFPGSIGAWKPPHVWWDVANTLTTSWGGLSRLEGLLPSL